MVCSPPQATQTEAVFDGALVRPHGFAWTLLDWRFTSGQPCHRPVDVDLDYVVSFTIPCLPDGPDSKDGSWIIVGEVEALDTEYRQHRTGVLAPESVLASIMACLSQQLDTRMC